jgi:type IV pilus assembly protein PilN
MNVEINLLRQKPKKHPLVMLIVYILAGIVLFNIGYTYYQYSSLTADIEKLETNVQNIQNEILTLETELKGVATNFVDEYEEEVKEMEAQHFFSVAILTEFISLLPNRSFFIDYDYNSAGNTSFYVQFDTLPAMSQYTDQVSALPWVTSVNVDEVEMRQLAEKGDVLPRYYAEYMISLDLEAIHAKQEKEGNR